MGLGAQLTLEGRREAVERTELAGIDTSLELLIAQASRFESFLEQHLSSAYTSNNGLTFRKTVGPAVRSTGGTDLPSVYLQIKAR